MCFVFKLNGNTYAIKGHTSGVLPSAVAKLNWAIPTLPPPIVIVVGHAPLKLLDARSLWQMALSDGQKKKRKQTNKHRTNIVCSLIGTHCIKHH